MNKVIKIFLFITLSVISSIAVATQFTALDRHIQDIQKADANTFAISLYRPTYVLPLYYTNSPDQKVYEDETPSNQKLDQVELKYQISFLVPIWQKMFHKPSSLYLAYTQLSYWQAYNQSAFFRETDYEPEIFVATAFNKTLIGSWQLKFFTVGAVHQSNGKGGTMERSWNRIYVEGIFGEGNWMVSIKPWYIIHGKTMQMRNHDIGKYLGHAQAVIAYQWGKQTFAVMLRNNIESGFRRGAADLTWSFPLIKKVRFYTEFFSGYGQSLIEYNHRTNSFGIGLSLNDWL